MEHHPSKVLNYSLLLISSYCHWIYLESKVSIQQTTFTCAFLHTWASDGHSGVTSQLKWVQGPISKNYSEESRWKLAPRRQTFSDTRSWKIPLMMTL